MIGRLFGAATLAAFLAGCAPPGGLTTNGVADNRPEGRRYVDYLLSDGGLQEIEAALTTRGQSAAKGQGLSFLSGRNLNPYNAPLLGRTRARRELNRLASCMIEAWGGPKPTVDVVISSGLAPAGQALPNQVAINLGLITAEDITVGEIAFVLAHELSHVFLDHYGREEAFRMQTIAADKLSQAALVAVVMSEMRGRRTSRGFDFFVRDDNNIAANASYVMAAYAVSQVAADGVIESSWARTQEFEADRLALDILARAGLSEEFGYQALRRVSRFQEDQKTRLENMETVSERKMNEAAAAGDANMIVSTGVEVFSKAVVSAALDLYDFIDRTHPSPAAREKQLDRYLNEFDDAAPVVPVVTCNTNRLERALRSSTIKSARKSIEAAFEVDAFLARGDINGARGSFNRSIQGGLSRHPVPRLAGFRVETAARRPGRALAHLERIRRGPNTPLAVHVTLASEYMTRKRYKNALSVIRKGEEYFLEDFFYPSRLQIAVAQGDQAEAARILALCELSSIDSIKESCGEIADSRKKLVRGRQSDDNSPAGVFDEFIKSLNAFSEG